MACSVNSHISLEMNGITAEELQYFLHYEFPSCRSLKGRCSGFWVTEPVVPVASWKWTFFWIEDSIVPSQFPQLISRDNLFRNGVAFKDEYPNGVEVDPSFQRLVRYPSKARVYDNFALHLGGILPRLDQKIE
ncbi:hypothetical protein Tco_0346727 [Tanacetum coccineum]